MTKDLSWASLAAIGALWMGLSNFLHYSILKGIRGRGTMECMVNAGD